MADEIKTGDNSARIAKVMARAGLCSRREAEAWIAAGRVRVNGQAITSPALDVSPDDKIEVDGEPLPQRERTRLFLFHKPRGYLTTNVDPEGRPTIYQVLPKDLPRVVSVGRLDFNTEGLLLLTNDGGLARELELPETGWLRRYRVRALGRITQARLDTLASGISIDGVNYGSIVATLDSEKGANIWITFEIREGKNREVRNVLGALGLSVNRLLRVSYGPFELGEIPEGGAVEVATRDLRAAIGPKIAQAADVDLAGPLSDRKRREPPSRAPRPERQERQNRPASGRDREDRDSRPPRRERTERPDRPAFPRNRDERPRRDSRPDRGNDRPRGNPRDGDRPSDRRARAGDAPSLEPPRKPQRKHAGDTHAWRGGDAPLRRKYRGKTPDGARKDEPARGKAGLIADRKGRRVLVQRFGEKKAEPEHRGGRGWGDHPKSERPFHKRGDGGGRRNDRGAPGRGDGPRSEHRAPRPHGAPRDARPPAEHRNDRPRVEQRDARPRAEHRDAAPRAPRSDDRPRSNSPRGDRKPPRDRRGGKGPRPSRPRD